MDTLYKILKNLEPFLAWVEKNYILVVFLTSMSIVAYALYVVSKSIK